jgi:hypothetical protein
VEFFFQHYVALPKLCLLPVALWAISTHVFERFTAFPYLAILSAVKGSGKTRLLEILEEVCGRPWRASTVSPAALFRKIAADSPTLLLDEAEVLSNPKSDVAQALRAILNSGYRAGASVPRCDPPKWEVHNFLVFCPKAFTAIGRLPETIADRSIVIQMQKKGSAEKVARFTLRRVKAESTPLRWSVERVMDEVRDLVKDAYEDLPELAFLEDREGELWEPLFAVCSVIAPTRIGELRKSAEMLSTAKAAADQDDSRPLRLLSDIREVFPKDAENILTKELMRRLEKLDYSPWFKPDGGRPECELNPRRLARMLRPFGISPRTVRVECELGKGYSKGEFQAPWDRYIPSSSENVT